MFFAALFCVDCNYSNSKQKAKQYTENLTAKLQSYKVISAASHVNHEEIHPWIFFSFLHEYGSPLGGPSGRQSSAIIELNM